VSVLEIRDLHVSVGEGDDAKEILRGVDLTIRSGETHAIMGPNGSGKSTLAYSIAGHPKYTITGGTVTLDGEDVLAMTVDERARAGLFLAMQYPVEVPGVSVSNFLRTAATAIKGEAPKLRTWVKDVKTEMAGLEMDPAFAERNVNEGFSGGEKKRHEILQMRLLKPAIAILDETDSGLDVDAFTSSSPAESWTRAARSWRPSSRKRATPPTSRTPTSRRASRRPPRRSFRHDPDRLASRSRGAEGAPASGRRGDPGGLPDPVPHRAGREAAGLPGLRGHLAEAAQRARRRA
jgi:Fe-S cluster assembly ATP-binding protein